jgi:hypothetical protein
MGPYTAAFDRCNPCKRDLAVTIANFLTKPLSCPFIAVFEPHQIGVKKGKEQLVWPMQT